MGEVGDAQRGGALHLVGVSGADAALGRADRVCPGGGFAGGVLLLVVRHDQVRLVRNLQVLRGDRDAAAEEFVDLFKEHLGIEHDAVADDVEHAGAEDADRQKVRGVFFAADADGMPGVGAAAVADDDVGVFGEKIDDLALALIPPLEADDNGISLDKRGHNGRLSVMRGCGFKRCGWTVKGRGGGVKESA